MAKPQSPSDKFRIDVQQLRQATQAPAKNAVRWLLVLALLFSISLGAAALWMDARAYQEVEEEQLKLVERRARSLATLVDLEFSKATTVLLSIEDRVRFRQAWAGRDLDLVQSQLHDILSFEKAFLFASVYEMDGTLRAIEPPDKIVGWNFAYRDWYKGVTSLEGPYVSEVYRTAVDANPLVVAVAVPIRNGEGNPTGILMAAFTLKQLAKKLQILEEDFDGQSYAVSQNGLVAASTEITRLGEQFDRFPESMLKETQAAGEGSWRNRERQDEFVGYSPISGVGWGLIYVRSADEAMRLANLLRNWGILAAGFLTLIYAVTTGIALNLVRKQSGLLAANQSLNESLHAARDHLEERVRERTAELVRTNQDLYNSEERFRAFMDNSPALAYMKDLQGRHVYANARWEESLQLTREGWHGKSVDQLWPQESAEKLAASDQAVLTTGKPDQVSIHASFGAGEKRDLVVLQFPIADTSGTQFIGGIAMDMTEYRTLEKQLQQSQKMEAVGHLAGGVAHDFNNLLGVILGYCELLLMSPALPDTPKTQLTEIKKAGERAATLTRQLLAFSRKQIVEPIVLDINSVVADMGKMLHRLIGEDVHLVTVLAPNLGRVKADPGQMEQVLMNLAVNARDAMPQGGKLTIETSNVELDEEYARKHITAAPGPYVLLAVSDAGIGMDEQTLARIFEPFFTTKPAGKGTGLGLATVYGIVKQSGGNIWVYSEPGKGTSFKIYLPRVSAKAVAVKGRDAVASPGGTETILVVEDAVAMRKMACEFLSTRGYTILEAADGQEALARAKKHAGQIHLLLTDVVMPGMSGRELSEQMTALYPDVKVLFMSGYTGDAVVRHGILEGEASFIQKPFTLHGLATRVRETLDS